MEFHLLEAFLVLAEERHFGRAASRLHVSQPALSYQVRRLERDLEVALLTRTTRTVELTPAGIALRDGARVLLDDRAAVIERVRRVARGEIGIVRIGCVAAALYGFVPELVREVRARYPEIQLVLAEKKTADQLADLASGRLDVALIHRPARIQPGVVLEDLYSQSVGVALPHDHPAAGRTEVPLGDLAASEFVLFPRSLDPDTYDLFVGACVAAGFAPTVSQEAENVQSLLALVAAGLGVAFVPAAVMDGPARPGVTFRRLVDAPVLTTSVAWPADRDAPAFGEFLHLARTVAARHDGARPPLDNAPAGDGRVGPASTGGATS